MIVLNKIKRYLRKEFGYFPSKVYESVLDYKLKDKSNKVRSYKKIGSTELFPLNLPNYSNVQLPERFAMNHFKLIPESYFAEINDCTIGMIDFRVGVTTNDNGLLLDLSPDHKKEKVHPFLGGTKCKAKRVVHGKTLVLAAPAGKGNFYHWMFHVIGRLSILKALEFDINEFDTVVVNNLDRTFSKVSLQDFGINEDKILFLDNNQFYKIANGFYPSYLYFNRSVPHFLKRHYLDGIKFDIKSNVKTYVSRRKSPIRKITNEKSVVDFLLKERGYNEVFLEDFSIREQAIIMNNSSHVIAPHGAGVPNIIYCEKGTKVIEIIPYSWVNVIYWIYANYQSLDYGVFMAGENNGVADGYLDYKVDIDSFRDFVLSNNL